MSAVGSILTNTGALEALNSIANTTTSTNNLENQLSTGLSINSPADNPAGYITAQGFTSQINGITQAVSNANQAVSLLQTAQGAIGQQSSVVQSLNSIAVQAANGTQTPAEAQSLQGVVSQLIGQVNTIAGQTQFNNINLLDGSFKGVQFQVGANEGQTMSLSIGNTEASSIGMWAAGNTTSSATFTAGTTGIAYGKTVTSSVKSVSSANLATQLGNGGTITITSAGGTLSATSLTSSGKSLTGLNLPSSLTAAQIGSGTLTLTSNGTGLTANYADGAGVVTGSGLAPTASTAALALAASAFSAVVTTQPDPGTDPGGAAADNAANYTLTNSSGVSQTVNLATILGAGGSLTIQKNAAGSGTVTLGNGAAIGAGSSLTANSTFAKGLGSGTLTLTSSAGGAVSTTFTKGTATAATTTAPPIASLSSYLGASGSLSISLSGGNLQVTTKVGAGGSGVGAGGSGVGPSDNGTTGKLTVNNGALATALASSATGLGSGTFKITTNSSGVLSLSATSTSAAAAYTKGAAGGGVRVYSGTDSAGLGTTQIGAAPAGGTVAANYSAGGQSLSNLSNFLGVNGSLTVTSAGVTANAAASGSGYVPAVSTTTFTKSPVSISNDSVLGTAAATSLALATAMGASAAITLKDTGGVVTGSGSGWAGLSAQQQASLISGSAFAAQAAGATSPSDIGNLTNFLGNGGTLSITANSTATGLTIVNNAASTGSGTVTATTAAPASTLAVTAPGLDLSTLGSGSYKVTFSTPAPGVPPVATGVFTAGPGTPNTSGAVAVPTGFTEGSVVASVVSSPITVTGPNGGASSIGVNAGESAASLSAAVNLASGTTGVESQAATTATFKLTSGTAGFSFTLAAQNVNASGTVSNVGSAISVNAASAAQIVTQVNSHTSTSGITAAINSSGALTLTQTSGANLAITNASTAASAGTLTTGNGLGTKIGGAAAGAVASGVLQGHVQFQSSAAFNVGGGAEVGANNAALQSLAAINVSTTAGANQAINVVKYALASLNNQGGALGAVQQSLTANINNLNTTSQNLTSALGVVQDANIPSVTNSLTEAEIQAQSGVAALKSSTQLQQSYLSLLP